MRTSTIDNPPAHAEIRQQLDHMLMGKRFAGAPNQSRMLAFVVTEALKGERAIKESIIALALFPHLRHEESTDVRVTASHLRDRLRRYYAQEGLQDRVIISLPEPCLSGTRLPIGAAYLPSFSYNSRLDALPENPSRPSFALEPFVAADEAARFLGIQRRELLALARHGIAGAYALGTGSQRHIWVFRLSELATAITSRNALIQKSSESVTIRSGSLRAERKA